ncbi:MAG TPA: histidine phosphatase family protein [Dehalococcoidia bacterium]|nr:histidine phosphatase family protein [Dehalococcoidia bacterium]
MPSWTGRLILVRHAKTIDNIADRFCGWTDSALSEEGLAAAEHLAAFVRDTYPAIDYLYSSPLGRARVTAGLIGLAIRREPIEEEGLREIHFGDIEGLTRSEFQTAYPSEYQTWSTTHDISYRWPGGESREAFHRRVRETIDRLIGRHPGCTVLAVSHGGCIAGYVSTVIDGNLNTWRDRNPDNCSVTEIVFADGRAELIRFNDTSFLTPAEAAEQRSL